MKILLKYLLRNIQEKKVRSFLVLISLALTSGLFFTSLAITDTIMSINLELHRSSIGNADIKISPKDSSEGNGYISMTRIGERIMNNNIIEAIGLSKNFTLG